MIERLVAAMGAMAASLYLLACSLAWWRVLRPSRTAGNPVARRVILDRAIAWTGLCVLFGIISGAELGVLGWEDDDVDLARLVALTAVYLAGLASVRAIASPRHGDRPLMLFVAVTVTVGVAILSL